MKEQSQNNQIEAKIEGIPLTVDDALRIVEKFAENPGVLKAVFDSGQLAAAEVRRLRERVKQLEEDNEQLTQICDTLVEDLTAEVKTKPTVVDARERFGFSSN